MAGKARVAGADGIRVVGIAELQKELRNVSTDLPKDLRKLNLAAAAVVAEEARTKAPNQSGKLRGSIVARAEQRGASVKGGGARVPYFGFIDFGNKVHGGGGVGRRDSHPRPFLHKGRIIYPALSDKFDEVIELYEDGLADLIERAGL